VRFEREDLGAVVATRVGRRWYLPVPTNPAVATSDTSGDVRVSRELRLRSRIDELAVDGQRVRIRGTATIDHVGPVRGRLSMVAMPGGAAPPLVLRTRVDAEGRYNAEVSLGVLRRLSRGGHRTWRLVLHSHDHGLRRIAVWHDGDAAQRQPARSVVAGAGGDPYEIGLVLAGRGRLTLTVGGRPPSIREARIDDLGVLDLIGDPGDVAASAPLAVGVALPAGHELPVHVERGGFVARLPVTGLVAHGPGRWPIELRSASGSHGLVANGTTVRATVGERVVEVAADDAGYLVVTVG
jgi:hypothetical protein